jgi:hypothetical protein
METKVEATKSPLNRALRREKAKANGSKMEKGLQEPNVNFEKKFKLLITNKVIREEWSLNKLKANFDPTNKHSVINDKPKYQRPDVDGSSLADSPANKWQQKLVGDFLIEGNLQPIYLRKLGDGTYEIVDGGHRSRSFWKWFKGWLHLPNGIIIKDSDGKEYDLSEMSYPIVVRDYGYEFAESLLELFKLDIRVYSDISDNEAEVLFIKLNNLNKMERADFRNAKNHTIADVVRNFGSVDSPNAFDIFKKRHNSKPNTLEYISVGMSKRITDTLVAFSLHYLWKGGLSNCNWDSKKSIYPYSGMDSETAIDLMYDVAGNDNSETQLLISKLNDPNDSLKSELSHLWNIVGDVIKNGQFTSSKSGDWKSGSIKKLIMLVCESAWANGGFENYNPNTEELFNQFRKAYRELTSSKTILKHKPHRKYELNSSGEVVVSDTQPKQNSIKDDDYSFTKVFASGARVDDLEYILKYFESKGLFSFGLEDSKDSNRGFNQNQIDEILTNSEYKCKCGKNLHEEKFEIDHILPHTYGGPSEIKNGQALCVDCNRQKSNGMSIDDVELLCVNYEYPNFEQLKQFTIASHTLTTEEIRKVKNIVISGGK